MVKINKEIISVLSRGRINPTYLLPLQYAESVPVKNGNNTYNRRGKQDMKIYNYELNKRTY